MKDENVVLDFMAFKASKEKKKQEDKEQKLNHTDQKIINDSKSSDNQKLHADQRIKARRGINKLKDTLASNPSIMEEAAWRMTNIRRPANDQLSLEEWRERTSKNSVA